VQQRSAELEHQYRRSEQILGAATDGFFATDLSGRIVDTNPAFCHMLGYTREELLQRSVLDIRASASAADVAAHIETVRRTGHDRYDTQHLRKDGSPVTVEVSLSQVMFGDEPLLFAFVRDISERLTAHRQLREAKEEAERANRAKSEFLSRMSHELRTPLNAILGFGQLLEIQAAESAALAPSAGQVREILHAGRHLLTLIDEVLDLARVESGNLSVSPEPVALLPLLQDCLTLMRPQAGARGVRLVEPAASCAVHLRADRTRLKQVLLNLLSNAIKYNRADGEVRIGCVHPPACPEGTLRVCVNDTGAGLSPAQQQRLFVPFERLDAEVQQIQGTGIGLALCKRLVELMGGAIGVESSPGAGSSFWVQLPVAPPPAEPPAPALPTDATTPAPAADHQRDVLCIEDNPANLRLIEGIFAGRSDVRLLTAHAPGTGLELARTHGPALILLDINLPDMDGYAVMRCLREHAATRSIPVIAVSANAMSSDLERAKAAGFAAYLTKPLDIAHALRVFDEVLARPPG
jgi:PAS domain S-box-containing protein